MIRWNVCCKRAIWNKPRKFVVNTKCPNDASGGFAFKCWPKIFNGKNWRNFPNQRRAPSAMNHSLRCAWIRTMWTRPRNIFQSAAMKRKSRGIFELGKLKVCDFWLRIILIFRIPVRVSDWSKKQPKHVWINVISTIYTPCIISLRRPKITHSIEKLKISLLFCRRKNRLCICISHEYFMIYQ